MGTTTGRVWDIALGWLLWLVALATLAALAANTCFQSLGASVPLGH